MAGADTVKHTAVRPRPTNMPSHPFELKSVATATNNGVDDAPDADFELGTRIELAVSLDAGVTYRDMTLRYVQNTTAAAAAIDCDGNDASRVVVQTTATDYNQGQVKVGVAETDRPVGVMFPNYYRRGIIATSILTNEKFWVIEKGVAPINCDAAITIDLWVKLVAASPGKVVVAVAGDANMVYIGRMVEAAAAQHDQKECYINVASQNLQLSA